MSDPSAARPVLGAGDRVAGGRYRLVDAHGGVPGQAFWRAHDERLDRDVAVVLCDPVDGGGAVGEVLDRTQRLARIYSSGVARVIDVIRGGGGGIVVADWTPGRSLAEAVGADGDDGGARTRPDARTALRSLAHAATRAEEAEVPLGLDSPERIRIAPDGHAVLAFPAVADGASARSDVRGLGDVLTRLLGGGPGGAAGDSTLDGAARGALDGSTVSSAATLLALLDRDGGETPGRTGRHETTTAGSSSPAVGAGTSAAGAAGPGGETAEDGAVRAGGPSRLRRLLVDDDDPDTHAQHHRWWIMAGAGVLAILLIGGILAWMVGLGQDDAQAPLAQQLDSLEQSARQSREAEAAASSSSVAATATTSPSPSTSAAAGPRIAQSSAIAWQPSSAAGSIDNPSAAPNVIDGEPGTAWTSESYLSQLGPGPNAYKPGVGLLLTAESAAIPKRVAIQSQDSDVTVEIRSATSAQPTGLGETTLLGTGTLKPGTTTIELKDAPKTQYLVVWITQLHKDGPKSFRASISEVSVTS